MRRAEHDFLCAQRLPSAGFALKPSLRLFLLSSREMLVASMSSSRAM